MQWQKSALIDTYINLSVCSDKFIRLTSRPALVWLPAGEAYACVDPSSASGTVVIPSMDFRGNVVKNLSLTFENGRIFHLAKATLTIDGTNIVSEGKLVVTEAIP